MNYKESLKATTELLLLVICVSLLFSGTLISFTFNSEDVEKYVFQYINEERTNRGLPALGNGSQLDLISKAWSDSMVQTGVLEHGDFQGRLNTIGYSGGCGEIVQNYSSPILFSWDLKMYSNAPSVVARELVDGWLNSPAHRQIMLTAQNGDLGVAVCKRGIVSYFSAVDFCFS